MFANMMVQILMGIEDLGMQICERSLAGSQEPIPSFVRAEMLPSGFLIRPCEGGGCIIHVVDHYDLEVPSA
jgi:homeobox-leucine zipper protein